MNITLEKNKFQNNPATHHQLCQKPYDYENMRRKNTRILTLPISLLPSQILFQPVFWNKIKIK